MLLAGPGRDDHSSRHEQLQQEQQDEVEVYLQGRCACGPHQTGRGPPVSRGLWEDSALQTHPPWFSFLATQKASKQPLAQYPQTEKQGFGVCPSHVVAMPS